VFAGRQITAFERLDVLGAEYPKQFGKRIGGRQSFDACQMHEADMTAPATSQMMICFTRTIRTPKASILN